MKKRIGILGGTFDPVHFGHLAIAEEVRYALGLSEVFIVPNAYQPLKAGNHVAGPQQRWEMVCLACQDNEALIPSDIEIRRPPPSYTIDTLHTFQRIDEQGEQGEHRELWFILGSDALLSFPRWRAAHEIIALARLAVVMRPGSPPPDLSTLETSLPGIRERVDLVSGPRLDISSSDLRQRIAVGQPVRYQMPDTVIAYIVQNGLYQENFPPCPTFPGPTP
jgi:nicotinate-nucleotide adenylyltransferase